VEYTVPVLVRNVSRGRVVSDNRWSKERSGAVHIDSERNCISKGAREECDPGVNPRSCVTVGSDQRRMSRTDSEGTKTLWETLMGLIQPL